MAQMRWRPRSPVQMRRESNPRPHHHWCAACGLGFRKLKMLEQHRAGKRHRSVVAERDLVFEKFAAEAPLWAAGAEPADVVTGWSPVELSAVFPMRATCLDKHATVGALPARARARFWRYLHDRFGARAPELAAVFHDVDARGGGRYLRVKELFEALEAADVIARHIAATEARRGGAPTTAIYDLACGHGLVGLLLAGRFRGARVRVDLARRGVFDAFLGATPAAAARYFRRTSRRRRGRARAEMRVRRARSRPSSAARAWSRCTRATTRTGSAGPAARAARGGRAVLRARTRPCSPRCATTRSATRCCAARSRARSTSASCARSIAASPRAPSSSRARRLRSARSRPGSARPRRGC